MFNEILLAAVGLITILIMIYGLSWLLKRSGLATGQFGFSRSESTITVKETKLIDGRNRLHVVNWNGTDYLIASNPSACHLIGSETAQDKDATDNKSFQAELENKTSSDIKNSDKI